MELNLSSEKTNVVSGKDGHVLISYLLSLVINFIDFKAAFDSVNREYIWTTLEHYGLPEMYIRIFKAFYTGTKSAVRVEGKLTEWLDVNLGTDQGGIQGPLIFNCVLNWALERAICDKVITKGFTLQKRMSSRNPQKNIPDVDYADDIAALDDSEAGLQETTTLIARSASDANLKINVSKTKVMCIDKHHVQRPYAFEVTLNVNLYGTLLDQVSYFPYLGQTLTCNVSIDKEIDLRIGKASGAFNMLNNIWKNNIIKLTTKFDIYSSSTLTVLLYGCSTWPTNERHLQRLEAFQQSCLRRILKVKYFHHVTKLKSEEEPNVNPYISLSVKHDYVILDMQHECQKADSLGTFLHGNRSMVTVLQADKEKH